MIGTRTCAFFHTGAKCGGGSDFRYSTREGRGGAAFSVGASGCKDGAKITFDCDGRRVALDCDDGRGAPLDCDDGRGAVPDCDDRRGAALDCDGRGATLTVTSDGGDAQL